jgi:hypothetical protein
MAERLDPNPSALRCAGTARGAPPPLRRPRTTGGAGLPARLLLPVLALAVALWLPVAALAAPDGQAGPGPGGAENGPTGAVAPAGGHGAPPDAPGSGDGSGGGGGGPVERAARELVRELQRWWELGFVGYALRAVLAVIGLVGGFLYDLLSGVCCGALNFVTRTPPELSYANPAVLGLGDELRRVANAALVVVAMWGGFDLMVRRHLGLPHADVGELVSRLVAGALLANTSPWWGGLAVDLNNALCAVVGLANPFPAWERLSVLDRASADGIALLVYGVAGVLLVLQQAARLALVDLLLAVAPLALLCWVVPLTRRWAALWSTTFAGAVYLQFLQAVALKLGAALLAAWAAGASTPLPDALAVLLGVAVLGLTLKLPGLLRTHAGDGLSVARYYALRTGAQALDGWRRGPAGAAPRAAARAAPLPPAAGAAAGVAAIRR